MRERIKRPNAVIYEVRWLRLLPLFSTFILFALLTYAQTPSNVASVTGVLRLRVRPKVNGKERGLPRKRFYLIKGGLEENKTLIEKINQQTLPTRECYYRTANATDGFINWLKDGDCESVYCRPIEEKFLAGPTAVREFQEAFERGAKEYKKPELARTWLTNNLADELRDGFYRRKQEALNTLIRAAETASGAPVISVMTDRNGTAFFTDLSPGTYLITNLLPIEFDPGSILWTCEVKVKPGDSGEKPFLISNTKDKNVKCVGVEKPLSACDAQKPAAPAK